MQLTILQIEFCRYEMYESHYNLQIYADLGIFSYAEGRGTSFSARKCGRPRSGRARVLVLEDERAFRVFGLLVC